ncbi:MAG: M28 family peptidase, partial [Promethearchaeota archaeon]
MILAILLNLNGRSIDFPLNDRDQTPASSTLSDSAHQFVDQFNATSAYDDIADQLDFGFRIPGTEEHLACAQWIFSESDRWGTAHWVNFTIQTVDCHHILTKISTGAPGSDIIVFSAHYDSRAVAEKDPDSTKQLSPILGANDGASGIAVMLELARVITQSNVSWEYEFWFLAIDAEDQGLSRGVYGIDSWDWCEGSEWMAADMETNPENYFDSQQDL